MRPYVHLLGHVINEAWQTWCGLGTSAPATRVKLGRSSRAFMVADFIKDEVIRRFQTVKGCHVEMEYGRPVLALAGGDLRLRLGKIDLTSIQAPRNDRQLSIWSQADAVAARLPGTPSGTWAKCGYVLDKTETHLASITVTCDLLGFPEWRITLPTPRTRQHVNPVVPMQTAAPAPARIASAAPANQIAAGQSSTTP